MPSKTHLMFIPQNLIWLYHFIVIIISTFLIFSSNPTYSYSKQYVHGIILITPISCISRDPILDKSYQFHRLALGVQMAVPKRKIQ